MAIRLSSIPEVQLKKADGSISALNPEDLLKIDPENLLNEYEVQAGWESVVTYHHALARTRIAIAERNIKELEAELFLDFRSRLKGESSRLPSVDVLKAMVTDSKSVREAYQKLSELMLWESQLSALRLGFQCKRDMLINMGAELRIDKKSQFRTL